MGLTRFVINSLLSIGLVGATGNLGAAAIVTLNAVDSGWYKSNGLHNDTIENYVAGWSNITGDTYRNWFVFDLTDVTDVITDARLRLELPSHGYTGDAESQTFVLSHVETPVASLRSFHYEKDAGGQAIYQDLGDGSTYATVSVTPADQGTTLEIALNADAIFHLNQESSLFAFGGKLADIHFGHTLFPGTYSGNVRQLVLTVDPVPEPSTMTVFALGGLCLMLPAYRRKRRSSVAQATRASQ